MPGHLYLYSNRLLQPYCPHPVEISKVKEKKIAKILSKNIILLCPLINSRKTGFSSLNLKWNLNFLGHNFILFSSWVLQLVKITYQEAFILKKLFGNSLNMPIILKQSLQRYLRALTCFTQLAPFNCGCLESSNLSGLFDQSFWFL